MLILALVVVLLTGFVLLLIPKFSFGRVLDCESFVPAFQVYQKPEERDLRNLSVHIEIAHRKLYKIKFFRVVRRILELLPSAYTVKPNKNGLFIFWAYPFDVINIRIGADGFRESYTVRHRVNDFASKYVNFVDALMSLVSPKLLHEECIEIPTTLGKTCGYSDKLSLSPGEATELMLSTGAEKLQLELVRVGYTLDAVDKVTDIKGTHQNLVTKFPAALGCAWRPTLLYTVPPQIKSGCYVINLADGFRERCSFIPLIVKPERKSADIAVIASTNTWHAYNSWGGQNFYINYTSFPSKYIVNTKRPFDLYARNPIHDSCEVTRDHLLAGERLVWAWLERENYAYDLFSDEDLHSFEEFHGKIKQYKIILINTHSEYWSYEMIDNLKAFIQKGGRVISLSGNTMYKEVKYLRKDLIALDGAFFRYQGFSEESVLGVAHDLRGYATWAPYKVVEANHWVFSETGLREGDVIGAQGLNVSPKGVPGASGWETDKIYPLSPRNTTLLAKGMNRGQGGADMILCEMEGGGRVFAVGSISFGGSLLVDDKISRIVKNVVEKFLK